MNKTRTVTTYIFAFLSVALLFVSEHIYLINYLGLLLIIGNIFLFCLFAIGFKKIKSTFSGQYFYINFFLTISYCLLLLVFLFLSFIFHIEYPFLSLKNISIIICFAELFAFLLLTFGLSPKIITKRIIKTKRVELTCDTIYINFRIKNKKTIIFNILLMVTSIVSFSFCGCFSKNGRLELFNQSITYCEKQTGNGFCLSFNKSSEASLNEYNDISKGFTDFSYFGQKKYVPLVTRLFQDDIANVQYSYHDVEQTKIAFLSFNTFDCYLYKDEWISTYSGLKYIGQAVTPAMTNVHSSFISKSLAEKIKNHREFAELEDVVGQTFNIEINGSAVVFFVSNIILDNSSDYDLYNNNYGDFIVIRKNDELIKTDNTFIDFYFGNSSSYNKEMLRYVAYRINDSNLWEISSNYNADFFNLADYWNILNNSSMDNLSILMFIVGFVAFFTNCIFLIIHSKRLTNPLMLFVLLLFASMLVQTILYCIWQFTGFLFLPSSSVYLILSVCIFSLIICRLFLKGGAMCETCFDQTNFYSISI